MASSEDTLRSPESSLPSMSVITISSDESMPLFMHVGEVRMRPSASRTDRLPSHATMYSRSYSHRPATQMSRACCASVFAWPGKSESGVKGGLLPGAESGRAVSFQITSGTLRGDLRNGPPVPWNQRQRKETITKRPKNPVSFKKSASLGINAAQFQHRSHSVDRQHVRRDAVVDLVRLGVPHHFIERILHEIQQPLVHFALPPEESLPVLHPFEIAHRYAAGIPQNIRYGEDTLGIDNSVGLPGGWPVCPFAKNLGLNLVRIFLGDLVFNGRGDGNVARLEEHVAGGHLCSASGKTLKRLLLRVHPVNHFRYVEALLVVEPAADISQPDDFVPGLLHQLRRHRADIAKTLHDHAAALFLQTNLGQRLVAAHHHAAARGFAPSAGSTQLNRFSCHHRRRGLPHVHRVGVHHPR